MLNVDFVYRRVPIWYVFFPLFDLGVWQYTLIKSWTSVCKFLKIYLYISPWSQVDLDRRPRWAPACQEIPCPFRGLKMPLDFGLKDLRLDIMPGYMSLWPQHPKFYHQYRHVCHNTQNFIINTGMFARTPKILSSIPACLRYGRGDMLSVHCSLWCDKLWGKAKKWFGLGAATSMCQGLSPSSVLERCQFELDGTFYSWV